MLHSKINKIYAYDIGMRSVYAVFYGMSGIELLSSITGLDDKTIKMSTKNKEIVTMRVGAKFELPCRLSYKKESFEEDAAGADLSGLDYLKEMDEGLFP